MRNLSKIFYTIGQKVYGYDGTKLTYYYKSGKSKAECPFINNMMEGEWRFYRENGELWQTGNFKNNMKHRHRIRFSKSDKPDYNETFEYNKVVRNKSAC